ncbi:MAG TPA: bifunctional chorismate mutase/prephenate dehydrogenase, partial [Alteromonas australica]|nr:bifunctional chorismate mutase/prephenate dehydrogenase [Alteromonas australica]
MADFSQQLNTLREGIDELDSQLVELLAKRSALTTQVGQIKAEAGMPVYVPEREKAL